MSKGTHTRRREARRCVRCNVPLSDGEGAHCDDCKAVRVRISLASQRRHPAKRAASQKDYKARRKERVRAEQRCMECGEPNDTSALRCSVCTHKAVDGARERRQARAA